MNKSNLTNIEGFSSGHSPSMEDFFNTVKDFVITFGWTKGVFTIFFFIAHYVYIRMVNRLISDRQREIDRLADDNREYRKHFMQLLEGDDNGEG